MERVGQIFGCVFAIAFAILGIVQIYAAFLGLEDWLGAGWAVAGIAVAFIFRSSLPILIGAFLCALNVWEWHWVFAALFAAPMLALLLPATAMDIFSAHRRRSY